MIGFCAESVLGLAIKYFMHKFLYMYINVVRGQKVVEGTSMIDLMQVKKNMLHYVQDLMIVKGM